VPDIREMIGKEVEVIANGVSYKGTLVEVSDTEVHLKTMLQWVALPTASVGQIKLLKMTMQTVAESVEEPEEINEWHMIEEIDQTGGQDRTHTDNDDQGRSHGEE
jgi:hypothetical protein